MRKLKVILLASLIAVMVTGGGAQAQQDPLFDVAPAPTHDTRPQPTQPSYIAMLFHRLTAKMPDFDAWARETEEYKSAPRAEKTVIMNRKSEEWQGAYNLLTIREDIVIETPVALSNYSAGNGGFFIRSFKDDTFFPTRFMGQNYAIVPERIMDKQWMKIASAERVPRIEEENRKGALRMIMTLSPRYTDGSAPIALEDEPYWLISAVIDKMALYAQGEDIPLWSSDSLTGDNSHRQELLKLKR